MQVAIYATEEKRRRTGFDHVLVLARRGEALILRRDRINACWVLPEGQLARGQSAEEAARSALGEAVGEAVFDVYPLCAYGVTEENGKESGGFCYVADVREWPDEAADEARAFDRLPLSSQMDRPALCMIRALPAPEIIVDSLPSAYTTLSPTRATCNPPVVAPPEAWRMTPPRRVRLPTTANRKM